MLLREWHKLPGAAVQAQATLLDNRVQALIQVVKDEHPAHQTHERGLSSQDLLIQHGIIKGYSMALSVLALTAIAPDQVDAPMISTFEPEN